MKTKNQKLIASSALVLGALATVSTAQASSDYGPAIWRSAYPGHWYTSGYGKKFYVIHDMEGYYWGTISYFQQSGTQASVHYCTNAKVDTSSDSPPGEITQMVADVNYAWHVGCWNQHCMGTEHEGFASNPAWYTDAQYNASAPLTKSKCEKYGFAKDRNHIVAHGEWQNAAWRSYASANFGIDPWCQSHTDPGPYWDWNKYMNLINAGSFSNPHINPVVARNSDGRLELFAVGQTGLLYHNYQNTSGGWSGWLALGGWQFAGNAIPAVGRNPDGRLEVFIVGTDGGLDHIWQQTAGNSSSWSGWAGFGGWTFSQTACVVANNNANGRLEIFLIGLDGALDHIWDTGSGWSGWAGLGGTWNQNACVAAGSNLDGRQEVFVIGTTGELYHNYQTVPNGGWSGWNSLGGSWPQTQRTALARNSDGRLEIFIIGNGGLIHHAYQTVANGGWYTAWPALGGWQFASSVKPLAALNSNGTLDVIAIGTDGHLNHINSANGWAGGWSSFGGSPAFSQDIRPCVGTNPDGRLEVFLTAPASDMVHVYQTTPSGSWYGWPTMGGSWY